MASAAKLASFRNIGDLPPRSMPGGLDARHEEVMHPMKKSQIYLFMSLLTAASSSMAGTGDGSYFVSAAIGQSRYHLDGLDNRSDPDFHADSSDFVGSVRFGYRWSGAFNFGVETGYIDFGKKRFRYDFGDYGFRGDVKASGWLLGISAVHEFDTPWYVSARAGLIRALAETSYDYDNLPYGPDYGSSGHVSHSNARSNWYAGVGIGYRMSEDMDVGLHYDNYRMNAGSGEGSTDGSVAAFTVQVEYRF